MDKANIDLMLQCQKMKDRPQILILKNGKTKL